nr:sigma-70 family RNA polymerase sigma factor [uncultured Prevotella sp.]
MTEEKEQQLERLFHNHYERMFRLAFALLHDNEEARDVVSDVFSKLWDKFSQEEVPKKSISKTEASKESISKDSPSKESISKDSPSKESFLREETASAYLMRSVKNACLNIISKKKRDERLIKFLPLSNEESIRLEEPSRLEERWQATMDCIDHDLSHQTAAVIRMCYGEGCSYRETAEELGISISAVNKHIVKGLRTLREKLKVFE